MIKILLLAALLPLSATACSQADTDVSNHNAGMITTTIVGSAESPDPVLEKVRVLRQKGLLKDVLLMETFPVQIRLTGPENIIKELETMPRKSM